MHNCGLVIRDAVSGDSINFTFAVLVTGTCAGSDFLTGNVYLDLNSNGVKDAGDVNSVYQRITAAPVGPFYSSNLTGDYGFYVPAGSYAVGFDAFPGWAVSEPSGGTYPLAMPGTGTTVGSLHFGLAPLSSFNDAAITTAITGSMSPGSTKNGFATVTNHGTTMLSGTVDLVLDSDVSYVSSSAGAIYYSGGSPVISSGTYSAGTHTVTYTYTDLPPFASFTVGVSCLIPAITPMGTSINFSATVNPIAGDATPADNTDMSPTITVGPYDPNDKQVSPAGIGPEGRVAPDTRLTYRVRFQNTGTWYANNVIVMDTLDADLDPATFEFTGASHPYGYSLSGNVLQVGFYGIMLPDSGMDEPGSHGFFTYSISPKAGLPLGTEATNRASIYFDFNPPIVTNSTITTFDSVTALHPSGLSPEVVVYPHPLTQQSLIQVIGSENMLFHFTLFNLNGAVLREEAAMRGSGLVLERNGLPAGIYFYQLRGEDGIQHNGKLLIQ
jgi:uncharacterized repeat protein (TIGR01451 family)